MNIQFSERKELQNVLEELKKRLKKQKIDHIILEEQKIKKRYTLYELDENILIYFEHGKKGDVTLQVGFPFSLLSEKINLQLPQNQEATIIIRGEAIRKIQRKELELMSKEYFELEKKEFKEKLYDIIKNKKRIIYIDAYDFIGDTYIGTYFLKSFQETFNIFAYTIYSKQYRHIRNQFNSFDRDNQTILSDLKENDFILMPDLIDTHWEATKETLNKIKEKNINIVVPGRNLLIEALNGELKTHHFNQKDILLRNKNIEDYMDDCLDAFGLKKRIQKDKMKENNTSIFFINPFANSEFRYISPKIISEMCKQILKKKPNAKFHVIGGYYTKRDHREWMIKLLDYLSEEDKQNYVYIKFYSDIDKLAEQMIEMNCSVIITADTSIAHLGTELKIPTIVVHNINWWDNNSMQAHAGSSPLGFSRYSLSCIPVLNANHCNEEKIGKIISDAALFMEKPRREKVKELVQIIKNKNKPHNNEEYKKACKQFIGTDFEWISNIFPLDELIKGVKRYSDKDKQLFEETLVKLTPCYKILKRLLP